MNTQDYNSFWQRIHRSAKDKGTLLRVMFELTYRCNFYCRHCYVPHSYRKKEELKTKQVFSILDQLADIGCFYLGFTGGEPFLRKDIMQILWYAKRCGFEIIIYTNGSLIDKKIANELSYLEPNKVDITIPAVSEGAFEQIAQMSGSHRKVFSAIDLLHKGGVNLGFKTCVLKENESEIKDIQDFAYSLGALHRLDDMLSPRLDGSKEPYEYRGTLKENLVSRHTSHAARHTLQASCDTGLEKDTKNQLPVNQLTNHQLLFKCGAGVTQAAITPLGELKMCLSIDYPKYKIVTENPVKSLRSHEAGRKQKMDLKEAWRRLKELVASIKLDENYQCGRCELEPYCKWCPAMGWLEDRKFTTCDSESRRWAESRKPRKVASRQRGRPRTKQRLIRGKQNR